MEKQQPLRGRNVKGFESLKKRLQEFEKTRRTGFGEIARVLGYLRRMPYNWETSRHGVVNHGRTMGNLATGSRENALNSGTAVRCLQGRGLTLRSRGQWPEYT